MTASPSEPCPWKWATRLRSRSGWRAIQVWERSKWRSGRPGRRDGSMGTSRGLCTRVFTAGQTVRINGLEGQLTSSFGSLEFRVTPPGASITYKRADETQSHSAENGKSARVRAGHYVVTATATGYRAHAETVTMEFGKSLPVEWILT